MPVYNFPNRREVNQNNEIESELTKFLARAFGRFPKQNFQGVATLLSSKEDYAEAMRNPNSQLSKDVNGALLTQLIIQEFNKQIIAQLIDQDQKLRHVFEYELMMSSRKRSLWVFAEEGYENQPLLREENERLEPLNKLITTINAIEAKALALQKYEIKWQLEKIDFIEKKLDEYIEKLDKRIAETPVGSPERQELVVAREKAVDFDSKRVSLKMKLERLQNANKLMPKELADLNAQSNDLISEIANSSIHQALDPNNANNSRREFEDGVRVIDDKHLPGYKQHTTELAVMMQSLNPAINNFENAYGKNSGLSDRMQSVERMLEQQLDSMRRGLDHSEQMAHHNSHPKR